MDCRKGKRLKIQAAAGGGNRLKFSKLALLQGAAGRVNYLSAAAVYFINNSSILAEKLTGLLYVQTMTVMKRIVFTHYTANLHRNTSIIDYIQSYLILQY